MGIIRQTLLVKDDRKEERLSVLFDSGASRSLIRSDIAKKLSTPKKLPIQREFIAANSQRVVSQYFCDLIVEIKGKRIGIEAFLVDNLPAPLVFGASDMEAYLIKLDLAKKELDLSEFTGLVFVMGQDIVTTP